MSNDEYSNELEVLNKIINALSEVDQDSRERLLETVIKFYGLKATQTSMTSQESFKKPLDNASEIYPSSFSEDRSLSPKEFLFDKQPTTDVERVACLAYYLTHYRNMPHFKTIEISKLNTEAAQIKFTNTAYTVGNAVRRGLLVPATKGQRQLSAAGERFVQALPDREAAKGALSTVRRRKTARRASQKTLTKS